MSNDKKSCDNCIKNGAICSGVSGYSEIQGSGDDGQCSGWSRDPRKWLSILPVENGWYWWKQFVDSIAYPREISHGYFIDDDSLVSEVGGELQGPISPVEET